ncbi:AMP-dependent synthetase/ligase [Magnetospirillum molischianum]|uniref:AMP-dependent synthetase and ligase n=1 Tax=Magnetospirillum molischianum DSM 120 TaxID=1150626 RepID=H8FN93_MAGML|nr:long-chain fatty acid--CoA ligase [Magnetospirillum molischianum]CCG39831.1 AMP-dependent synthetase and ligase [Magnetospirillum molischianum DSM 120]
MEDIRACKSLPGLFFGWAARLGEKPFLVARRDGEWRTQSWRAVADEVLALSAGLERLGVTAGDRVALIGENRPEWAIADLAIMATGAITVPAYTTNTVADHRHILDNSGAKLAIVSTPALAHRVLAAAAEASARPGVIVIDPPFAEPPEGIVRHSWDEVMALGRASGAEAHVRARVAGLRRDHTACIIHTSGTGGVPKGVMLSHGAILHNCYGAAVLVDDLNGGVHCDEVFLSFLPLSHAYEHTAGLFLPISIGATIYYADSIEHLSANMLEVRPTIMTAVPRLYDSIRIRILKGLGKVGRLRQTLFHAALSLGERRIAQGGRLGPLDSLADRVLDRVVRDKIRDRFGGRLKAFVSGGAPLPPEVGRFFLSLGVTILQGYGQTEAAPVISVNRPGRVRVESVGPVIEGVEIRIAADGEILVRGEMVMQGYWQDPASTAAAIDPDGWLHTGDIGVIDPDGNLRITDRKKDIIVNSGGDNVSPQRIECLLTLQPGIAQAMVHGDRRPHLVALIVPDPDRVQALGAPARERVVIEHPRLKAEIAHAVEQVNAHLAPVERIRRFTVLAEPFSVENGLLTPTMKIRRHLIRESHAAILDGMYEDRSVRASRPKVEAM